MDSPNKEDQEDRRLHQLPFGVGDEVRQVRAWIQVDPQNVEKRKGQVGYHCRKYSSAPYVPDSWSKSDS